MKILIECFHGIGDFVCALPMIKALRDRYSDAKITVLVKININAQLLSLSKIHVDQVIVWDVYKSGLKRNFKLVSSLRKEHYDYFVSSFQTPVKKAKFLAFLIKANQNLGCQFNKKINLNKLAKNTHFVDGNLMGISELSGIDTIDPIPHLFPDPNVISKIECLLDKLISHKVIGLCIGEGNFFLKNKITRTGKFFAKGWGIENFNSLIKLLLKNNHAVVLLGGQLEKSLLSELDQNVLKHQNVLNLVGNVDISSSVAACSLCDIVVGVDTGMMHIAAAVGTITLSIFGPTSPLCCGSRSPKSEFSMGNEFCRFAPCYGSKKFWECHDRRCLNYQTVESVYAKVVSLLRF